MSDKQVPGYEGSIGPGPAQAATRKGCGRAMKVYIDINDWWIGLYRGPNHYYLCPVPCVVIRWDRHRVSRLDLALAAAIERGIKHDDAMERREGTHHG